MQLTIHNSIQNSQFRIQHCLSLTYYPSLSCAECQEAQSRAPFANKVGENLFRN